MSHKMTSSILRIAFKETTLFFASPIAYLFLATFAAVSLFVFFWGESFFARNIADVRPLFDWMPLLLIFLASTLTMRLWSEERRTGTLEHVHTQPLPLWYFVVGKFIGCLVLLLIALLITLPLPITVAIIGNLDWGPVFAGYIATLLLGAAYLSIGLFVSARSDNQIVSLISAVALCGVFYLIGTSAITDFFGTQTGEAMRLIGTGSRFDAIERGVIDFRDLYYYISLIAIFLTLNTYVLEKERWATKNTTRHHQLWRSMTALLVLNAIAGNLWLGQITSVRIDATEGRQYSISPATKEYLGKLREPMLVRGYFSEKTHPILAPLVPQLRDLMQEYEIAGNGNLRVEFIDPAKNPELEEEANKKYGITPVPFQISDRYQASIVSSYFNVLIKYGSEHEVLSFRELIEVRSRGPEDIDVMLRNPEYDLTNAIKKAINSYQAGGNPFDTVQEDINFVGYVSNDGMLPEELLEYKNSITTVLTNYQSKSNGRFNVDFVDPDANGGVIAQQIAQDYGFQPMATSVFSNESFFFYLTLNKGQQLVQIPLEDLTEARFEANLESAIKRFASGFTKTVAFVAPDQDPQLAQFGIVVAQFNALQQFLGEELNVITEDVSDGTIDGEADILVLVAPTEFDEKMLFAVDQFLMKGGTVIMASSPFLSSTRNNVLTAVPHNSGLKEWLDSHGISIEEKLVMDTKNVPFPVPTTRTVGGFTFQDMAMLDYPFFVDVRENGLNQDVPLTSELPQTTMAWASPIMIDAEKSANLKITELVRSSEESWLDPRADIMPREQGFFPQGDQKSHILGLVAEGSFNSFFAGESSPLLEQDEDEKANEESEEEQELIISGVIEKSPESARIILYSSNDFLRDQIVRMLSTINGSEYLNTMQLVSNTVDWALEDAGLLSIKSRSHFNRTLPPMDRDSQLFWEYLNYILAFVALVVIALIQQRSKLSRNKKYLQYS